MRCLSNGGIVIQNISSELFSYREVQYCSCVTAEKSAQSQVDLCSYGIFLELHLHIAGFESLHSEKSKTSVLLYLRCYLRSFLLQVTDLQTQLNRSEQQAARREDNLRQEIADIQMV